MKNENRALSASVETNGDRDESKAGLIIKSFDDPYTDLIKKHQRITVSRYTGNISRL